MVVARHTRLEHERLRDAVAGHLQERHSPQSCSSALWAGKMRFPYRSPFKQQDWLGTLTQTSHGAVRRVWGQLIGCDPAARIGHHAVREMILMIIKRARRPAPASPGSAHVNCRLQRKAWNISQIPAATKKITPAQRGIEIPERNDPGRAPQRNFLAHIPPRIEPTPNRRSTTLTKVALLSIIYWHPDTEVIFM